MLDSLCSPTKSNILFACILAPMVAADLSGARRKLHGMQVGLPIYSCRRVMVGLPEVTSTE